MADVTDLDQVRQRRDMEKAFAKRVVLHIPEGEIPQRQPVLAPGWLVRVFDPAGGEAFMLHCEDGSDEMRMGMMPASEERTTIVNALCEALTCFGYRVDVEDKP